MCCAVLCCGPGVEGEVIIQKVLGKPFTVGYNAMSDKIVDLIEEGVIDPAKVTRNGLMNACSIAGIMLTTQVGGGHAVAHEGRVACLRKVVRV
jgi:chaperonin GroEL (HSP60 family)